MYKNRDGRQCECFAEQPGRLSSAPSAAGCRGKVPDRGIRFVHRVNGGFVGGAARVAGAPAQNPLDINPSGSKPTPLGQCKQGHGTAPSTKPLCATAGCAERERRGLCAARSFVSVSCCCCSAFAASSTLQLSRIAMCFFFFPGKTGLLQCALCNFPGPCPSHDSKSSKRMRCSRPKQCCTYG